ncbi:unnamed protein product [Spirodela intermedia]|uniref:ubiquitinyl hydrolase 1 n=1 Tax=Spirodela intermedia TaxID=51605 RepID=A0A7I8KSW4_SPIIN|nr:unnamed protein product [Spirodela intermedia]
MLHFQAVLLGLPSALKLACLLFVPVFALVIRRKWKLAAASREEVKRLVILAAEEAANAEIEAANEYRTRLEYESSPSSAAASEPKGKPMCAVCNRPTTTRCSRCKAVKYCSGKCQIIHWRQGHKEECRPPLPDSKPKDKATSSKLSTGKMLFSYDTFVKLYNDKVEMRPFGLMNCGNSCYANVVLQCLAFTRPLNSYLLQGFHSKSCAKSSWCFTCELESLISKAKQGESVLSPAGIMSQLPNIGAHLGPGREEDAHEFLRSAVDTMQSASYKTRGTDSPLQLSAEATFMQLIFGGYIRSKIKCMNCQSNSVRNERMLDLTVGIPGDVRTLQEALFRFTATEILDGDNQYECSRCKSYQKAKKRLKVLEAPNILTIALKRFQSGKFGKLNKAVVFPEHLNLADYMTSSSRNRDKSPVYQLYAVVAHLDIMNAAFSGHYVCYVRNASGKWYKIDDSTVKPVELEKVLSKTAYMLFYARRSPKNTALSPHDCGNGRPKSKSGEDLPAVPPCPRRPKNLGRFDDDSDGGASSLFSRSSSDGGGAASCSTESARYSSSTEGPEWIFGDNSGGSLWSSPAGFSDDSDGGVGWWRRLSPTEPHFPDSPESGYSASELSSSSGHDDGYPARGLSYDGNHTAAETGDAAAFLDSDDRSRHFRKLTLHRSSSSSSGTSSSSSSSSSSSLRGGGGGGGGGGSGGGSGGNPSRYKSVPVSRSVRERATQTRF